MKLTNTIRREILKQYVSLELPAIQEARKVWNQEVSRLYHEQHKEVEDWFKTVPKKFQHFIYRKSRCYLYHPKGNSWDSLVTLSTSYKSYIFLSELFEALGISLGDLSLAYYEEIGEDQVFSTEEKVVIPSTSEKIALKYKEMLDSLSSKVEDLGKVLRGCSTTTHLFEILPELNTALYVNAIGDVSKKTALIPMDLVKNVRRSLMETSLKNHP